MSDSEIIELAKAVARESVLMTLKEQGFQINDEDYVTENYAVTHMLKPYRIGRKSLKTINHVDSGRFNLYKREDIHNLILRKRRSIESQ